MYLYQLKLDRYESFDDPDNVYPAYLLVHSKQFTHDEFQKMIELAKSDMGHCPVFSLLPKYLEKYGFTEVIIGYFEC